MLLPVSAPLDDLVDAHDHADVGVDPEACQPQPVEHLVVSGKLLAFRPSHRVDPGGERARGRHPGIELSQRPGRGVPGVGERRLPARHPLLVQAGESGQRQVDLAPHLDGSREGSRVRPHGKWHRGDGPQVGGHVLADLAVAARRTDREAPAVIAQRHSQPVDLRLDDELQRRRTSGCRASRLSRACAHHPGRLFRASRLRRQLDGPGMPGPELLLVPGVRQRQHGLAVPHLTEDRQRLAAYSLRGRVGRHQLGMLRLQLLEFPVERVVLSVGDLGLIEHVVTVLVMANEVAKLLEAFLDVHRAPPGTLATADKRRYAPTATRTAPLATEE